MAKVMQPDRQCVRCKGMGLVSVPINDDTAEMRLCPCTKYEGEEAKVVLSLRQQGLVRIDNYEPGAEQWCTGSLSFPEADPPYDSWGDCTECGEPLIWVQKAEG